MIGVHLGPYEIIAPIGAGGRGVGVPSNRTILESMKGKFSKLTLVATLLALALLGWTQQAGAAIPAGERQALLDLYTSTNGLKWTNH